MPMATTGCEPIQKKYQRSRLIARIVLQNSQNAGRLIFRGKTKQATIADQCSLKPATGIACEFGARRHSLPHNYSIVAPTARRIWLHAAKRLCNTIRGKADLIPKRRKVRVWHAKCQRALNLSAFRANRKRSAHGQTTRLTPSRHWSGQA